MGCLFSISDLLFLTVCSICCTIVTTASPSADGDDAKLLPHYNDGGNSSTRFTARWQTDEFSTCSVPCGGGQQHRLIRCIKEDAGTPGVVMEVPTAQCPTPMPNISQPCNIQMCMGQWKIQPWSSCSVTCGEGVQKRDVICESFLLKDHQFQVADVECGGQSPDKYRKCYERDCPNNERVNEGVILSENFTLIQISRVGRLKLNVGGEVKILRGQTVMIKCPMRHFSRRLVYWSKDNKLIPHEGRIKVTAVGLRIQKADPKKDAGIYICSAGDKKAQISVQFTSKRDPLSSLYRFWVKKSRRRFRRRHPKTYSSTGQERSNIDKLLVISPFQRQRDESLNGSYTMLSFVNGNWSECSVTCGSRGERHRKVFCAHVNSMYIKIVGDEECYKQGLKKPAHVRRCAQGPVECPIWRTGQWSKCVPWCGDGVGWRSRILMCEWEGSRTPAWNSCDLSNKPPTRKPCKPVACPNRCEDSSSKCHRVRQFKMCRFKQFLEKCCRSCRDFNSSTRGFYRYVLGNRVDSNNVAR